MRFVEVFRPGWLRVALSLFPAYVLGWIIGPLLYALAHCWSGGIDCVAYSPTKIVLSYLLSRPILLLEFLLEKVAVHLRVMTINPLVPAFVVVWLYYYLLVSAAVHGARRPKIPVRR